MLEYLAKYRVQNELYPGRPDGLSDYPVEYKFKAKNDESAIKKANRRLIVLQKHKGVSSASLEGLLEIRDVYAEIIRNLSPKSK